MSQRTENSCNDNTVLMILPPDVMPRLACLLVELDAVGGGARTHRLELQ